MGTLSRHDMPIYRYIPFDRFYQMLFSERLALVSPRLWPDTYEMYWLHLLNTDEGRKRLAEYVSSSDGDQKANETRIKALCDYMYNRYYCLCFSKAKDAEVLWNARLNNNNGIMFATSWDRIHAVLPSSVGDAVVKDVNYDLEYADAYKDFLARFSLKGDVVSHSENDELLLHKRTCFSYEEEVRLLFRPNDILQEDVIKYPIPKLGDFIMGVMVHPRADSSFVSLVELLCKHFGIEFWGKSKIYDFQPLTES